MEFAMNNISVGVKYFIMAHFIFYRIRFYFTFLKNLPESNCTFPFFGHISQLQPKMI
jgi:hypothetical protein